MLLMQYNDNIPAVFGFPLVIPHQRRGGMEEEERRTGGSALFLAMLGCFCPFLHLFSSLLLPSCCPPCQACCLPQGQGKIVHSVYFNASVCIHGLKYVLWGFLTKITCKCRVSNKYSNFYKSGMGMKQTSAVNPIIARAKYFAEWQRLTENIPAICQNSVVHL